jgi:hypothetical protein
MILIHRYYIVREREEHHPIPTMLFFISFKVVHDGNLSRIFSQNIRTCRIIVLVSGSIHWHPCWTDYFFGGMGSIWPGARSNWILELGKERLANYGISDHGTWKFNAIWFIKSDVDWPRIMDPEHEQIQYYT